MSNEKRVSMFDFHKLTSWWPIIVTALAITVTAASANTRLDNLNDRVNYIWNTGPPPVTDRLARIEEKQSEMAKTLDRVEAKIDDLEEQQNTRYTVSPEAKKKLRRL